MPRRPLRASGERPAGSRPGGVTGARTGRSALADEARAHDRPKAATPGVARAGPARPLFWQLGLCAGLCAAGLSTGLVRTLAELALHTPTPRAGVHLAGVALATGTILGLWLPRQLIRRRVHGEDGPHREAAGSGLFQGPTTDILPTRVEFEFAATLSGILIVALGIAWALLLTMTGFMESYRTALVQHLVVPPPLTWLLLLAPIALGLLLVGGILTTVILALQGWQRLVTGTTAHFAPLAPALLIGGTGGAFVAARLPAGTLLALLTLLLTFTAAILAVVRKPGGQGAARVPVHAPPRLNLLNTPLFLLAATAAAVGAALASAAPISPAPRGFALEIVVAGCATFVGTAVGRGALRLSPRATGLAPIGVLATAVALDLPRIFLPPTAAGSTWELLLVTATAAVTVILAGRPLGDALDRGQRALVWTGVTLALGFIIGLTAAHGAIHAQHATALGVVLSLLCTAVAGLGLVLQHGNRRLLRLAGLTAVAAWLAITLLTAGLRPGPAPQPSAASEVRDSPARRAALELLQDTAEQQTTFIAEGPSDPAAREIDFSGPANDLVLITARDGASPAERESLRRFLRRCGRSLLEGGHIVIELPNADLAREALSLRRAGADLLRVSRDDATFEALILSPYAADWLHRDPLPAGTAIEIHHVHSLDELTPAQALPEAAHR